MCLVHVRRIVLELLICLVLVGCNFQQAEQKPEIGMDFYSVSQENITEVLFSASDRKIYAFRWNTTQPFHLIVASSGSNVAEQCVAGTGFSSLLSTVATAKIIEEMKLPFAKTDPSWTYILLRDTSTLEPISVQLRIPSSSNEPVVIQLESGQFIVEMNVDALHRAKAGCSKLSK